MKRTLILMAAIACFASVGSFAAEVLTTGPTGLSPGVGAIQVPKEVTMPTGPGTITVPPPELNLHEPSHPHPEEHCDTIVLYDKDGHQYTQRNCHIP